MVEWSQSELAAASDLSLSTVRDFEKGRRVPTKNNLVAMLQALEKAGVEVIDGNRPGVRLRAPTVA